MTSKELKILMIYCNVRPTDIARDLNVTDAAVYMVRNGHGRSRRIEQAIADRCRSKREDIFPVKPEPLAGRKAA